MARNRQTNRLQRVTKQHLQNHNSCLDAMQQLNEKSGNLLSDPELGQLCKDITKIANENLSVSVYSKPGARNQNKVAQRRAVKRNY